MKEKRYKAYKFPKACIMSAMVGMVIGAIIGHTPDWSYVDTKKYCIIFSPNRDEFQVRYRRTEEGTEVYFSTEEAAQKCADWLNAHWKESTEVGDTDEV